MSNSTFKAYSRSVGKLVPKNDIEKNLKLVVKVANGFCRKIGSYTYLEDLIQEGNIALMKAVEKFNPEISPVFSSYACFWIKEAMSRKLNQYRDRTIAGGAKKINHTSLDNLMEKGHEVATKKDFDKEIFIEQIHDKLKECLSEKEYKFIKMNRIDDMSSAEIGRMLGYTPQGINWQVVRGMRKLKTNEDMKKFYESIGI